MWWSGGHHEPIPSVKRENASPMGAATTTDACTAVSEVFVVIASPLPAVM
jgi:hypothetical protein